MTYHLRKGLIHYYYGNGRGKTSTTIGTIIRAMGQGLKPILIQFLKLHDETESHSGYFMGEINYLDEIIPIRQFGRYEFVNIEHPSEKDIQKAQEGLEFARDAVNSGAYDLVVLDEIVDTIKLNMIELEDLMELLQNKPKHVEIILTGHFGYNKILGISHYITHFSLIHHPFYDGFEARKGIEY